MNESLFNAAEFAARAHRGQFRKGSEIPYLVHPLNTACILIEHQAPNRIVVAAVLYGQPRRVGRGHPRSWEKTRWTRRRLPRAG